jgi:predicted kinase
MSALIITRGLPGSGKTTHARAWVAGDRANRARVNRDDLRAMLDDSAFEKGVTEPRILAARDAAILGLLGKGLSVICDDTNLPQRTARDLARLARRARADFCVCDYTDVPLETCIARDAARTDKRPVGETVIRDMHIRYLAGRQYPLPQPEEPQDGALEPWPYSPAEGSVPAVLVDIDGTVALKGARSPFDETRVHEDRPNLPVITVVRAMAAQGYWLVFVSGRTAGCRAATEKWLAEHVGAQFGLYMRAEGDKRKDSTVKREIFDEHIREAYDVACVIDDRNQVVTMWRSLGLTVLQCAEGDF